MHSRGDQVFVHEHMGVLYSSSSATSSSALCKSLVCLAINFIGLNFRSSSAICTPQRRGRDRVRPIIFADVGAHGKRSFLDLCGRCCVWWVSAGGRGSLGRALLVASALEGCAACASAIRRSPRRSMSSWSSGASCRPHNWRAGR